MQVRSFVETRNATIPRFSSSTPASRSRAEQSSARVPVDGRRSSRYVKRRDESRGCTASSVESELSARGRKNKWLEQCGKPEERLAGLKILVIDDSKTIRRTAETLLAKEGCEVFTAVDGFDALSKIADHRPDIIFVDIMMPRLDGYQTCSLIKHNKVFKDTPVIMLSSKDGLFDRARGRLVGSEQYLTKPFTKETSCSAPSIATWPSDRGVGTMALIMIVDDSPTEVHVLKTALEKHGFDTVSARTGRSASASRARCVPTSFSWMS